MAESNPRKPARSEAEGLHETGSAAPAPAASVPDAQPTPGEDGDSFTRPPDDDGYDDVAAAPTDWSVGQGILDDYVVERELGAGGMGKVYLLRSRSTGQPFAVKRAFLRNEDSRRNFLAELRTWIDLPEHPHLVACRFFRTVGDEVVIFAEFVEGGSLADWIRDRRLKGLEHIPDVAIQFAWGLHAAHELGLVHQDVKPGGAGGTVPLQLPRHGHGPLDEGRVRGGRGGGQVRGGRPGGGA